MTIAQVSKKYEITQDTLRYYEKVGMIPPVNRTAGGQRDYTPQDCQWVELAKCMRGAGLPVEAMIEYVKLFREGDKTIPERLQLLTRQKERLLEQRREIDNTLERLTQKIARYEIALKTGVLSWEKEQG